MHTYRTRRKRLGRYNDTNDHIFFVAIILLGAALYANHLQGFIKEQITLELSVVGIVSFIILISNLRKAVKYSFASRSSISPIDKMNGLEFERYVANLLPRQGYRHIKLTEHYDLGLDIIAEKENEIWGIQVKRHSSQIKISAVRQAVAALKHYGCDRAMVITNSSFSSSAQDLAKSNNCLLIDRQQLLHWAKDI